MLKTNVVKRTYSITCQNPGGDIVSVTVEAESEAAALDKGLPEGWTAVRVEAAP